MKIILIISFLLTFTNIRSQEKDSMVMYLHLDTLNHIITGKQIISIQNRSKNELKTIFLHAWTNSYSSKESDLTKYFLYEQDDELYFSNKKDRGYINCSDFLVNNEKVKIEYPSIDIIKVKLNKPFKPNEIIKIETKIKVKIQNSKFSLFGYSKDNYRLKDWHLVPAIYKNEKWQLMSNKNFDDLFSPPMNYVINLTMPSNWHIESGFNKKISSINKDKKVIILTKNNATNFSPIIKKDPFIKLSINRHSGDTLDLKMDFNNIPYENEEEKKLIQSIAKECIDFIEKILGKYPYKDMMISKIWLDKHPIPELFVNNLININIIPKKEELQLSLFKLIINEFIDNTIFINSRKNRWIKEGLKSFIMCEYINDNLKNPKILRSLADLPIIRYYNFSKLRMNDKHPLIQLYLANKQLDQRLDINTDSLYKVNRLYGNDSKMVLILSYIKHEMKDDFNKTLKEYFENNKLKISFKEDFLNSFKSNNGHYRKVLSYLISNNNSIEFKKGENLFNMKFSNELEYSDYKLSNIYSNINIKFIGDLEKPDNFNLFVSPFINWDNYNKLSFGINFYNHMLLDNLFNFNITPTYSSEINDLIGSYSFYFLIKKRNANNIFEDIKIGSSYNKSLWNFNKFFYRFYPYINLKFKSPIMRKQNTHQINMRFINLEKQGYDKNDPNYTEDKDYNYSIFNINYSFNRNNVINNFYLKLDFEFSSKFQKVYLEAKYMKKLSKYFKIKNRNFIGFFLHNKTNTDYYDFRLNDPNDYLFDRRYLSRSSKSGIFSQQTFIAEGGFKSKVNVKSKDWIISNNVKFVFLETLNMYFDLALLNTSNSELFFDSGLGIDIFEDIMELYFPFYSSNGLELKGRYLNKIRFVFNTDIISLIQKSISEFLY